MNDTMVADDLPINRGHQDINSCGTEIFSQFLVI